MVSQHRNGERNGETWKIAYRDWKPSITMERGTWEQYWNAICYAIVQFCILLTKMNMRLLLVGFIPEKT
jgi:hypothetical protein